MLQVMAALKVWSLRLLLPVAIIGVWLYAAGPGGVSTLILPLPGDVFREFVNLFSAGYIGNALLVTAVEILGALIIAAILGLTVGFYLARKDLRALATEPMLAWAYMFPIVLLYPVFLLWMGVGISSKIAYAAVAGVIPIAYNTLRGLRVVDPKYIRVGRAFGASSLQVDWHINIGAARPMILSGLRIGVSVILIGVILAELIGSNAGLGFELKRATGTLANSRTYALMFFLIGVTSIIQWFLERVVLKDRR